MFGELTPRSAELDVPPSLVRLAHRCGHFSLLEGQMSQGCFNHEANDPIRIEGKLLPFLGTAVRFFRDPFSSFVSNIINVHSKMQEENWKKVRSDILAQRYIKRYITIRH